MTTQYVKVLIGRFQPFHDGHLNMLRSALSSADKVVVVIGSAQDSRTFKNPFTARERTAMIALSLSQGERKRVHFVEQWDRPGADQDWVAEVKGQVEDAVRTTKFDDTHITLIGCHKGSGEYYLNLYKGWSLELVPHERGLNATDIRKAFFHPEFFSWGKFDDTDLPPASAALLWSFAEFHRSEMEKVIDDRVKSEAEKITR